MPTTYTPLATTTLGSTATEVTFPSISGSYTDLVLVCSIKPSDTSAPSVLAQLNSDTATNYSETRLVGNGTTASSARRTDKNFAYLCDTGLSTSTNTTSGITTHFQNYSNTTTYKTILSRANTPDLATEAIVNLWRSTSAITSIKIFVLAGGFAAGSTFSLYGIASAAVVSGAKATGGDTIATDGTYWYHAFRTSGTFTPTQALSCDVLVVGGGASGGFNYGGGGGAGGVFYATSQSLSTAQTVTIGAGGAGAYASRGQTGSDSTFGSLTAAKGGGGGGGEGLPAISGGCGGGGIGYPRTTTSPYNAGGTSTQTSTGGTGYGFAGGTGAPSGAAYEGGGGGGGAGAVGGNNNGTSTGKGDGGIGTSVFSAWGLTTGTGQNVSGTVYFAGGGGNGAYNTQTVAGAGGNGGGGRGSWSGGGQQAQTGTVNTGGGGGGMSNGDGAPNNAGGSGIIIVRYPV